MRKKILTSILTVSLFAICLNISSVAEAVISTGQFLIDNSGNDDSGLVVSTDVGNSANSPLVLFESTNSAFDQSIVQIRDNRATGGTVFLIDAIREGTTGGDAIITATGYGINTKGTFIGRAARGTEANPSALKKGDELVFFGGRGYGETEFHALASSAIIAKAEEDWTDTEQGSFMVFETAPIGSSSSSKMQRLKLASSEAVFNEYGVDTNFRVEGSSSGRLFVVDAGLNQIIMQNNNNGNEINPLVLQNPFTAVDTAVTQTFASTYSVAHNTNGLTKLTSTRQVDGSTDFSFLLSPGNAGSPTERMRIDGSNGQVTIHNSYSGNNIDPLVLQNPHTTANTSITQTFANTDKIYYNTNGLTKLTSTRQADGSTDFSFLLSPGGGGNPTENMKIDGSSGDVEISNNLNVNSTILAESLQANNYHSEDGSEGLSIDVAIKGSDGNDCTMTFKNGLLTATTCP